MNPIKPTFKSEIVSWLIITATIISAGIFYNYFPDQVPIHWNAAGEPDNYGSRFFGAFMIPAVIVGMYIMFLVLPYIDPKKERYVQFRKAYHVLKTASLLVMYLIFLASGLNIIGYNVPIDIYVPIIIGLLFIVLGNYMGKIKKNWFVGIKTPWTLSSEEVWNKTHRLGGKVFIAGGVILASTPLFPPSYRMWILIINVLLITLGTFAYSFLIYKKTEQKDANKQSGQS